VVSVGIYCTKCETLHKTNSIPRKCPSCGNTDITLFIRADDCDFHPNKDADYLKSRSI
jgi:predicted RNA-binding Zn-ribbon protein involved in translation (DUF1610 family)